MPVGKDSQQIAVILPKEIVRKLDELAKKDLRTRSKQCAKIIIDHLKIQER